VTVGAYRQYNT